MSRIAYVNGRFVPHRQARISIDDRGYQFADGVYEVCEVFRGAFVDEQRHMERLAHSLTELRIDAPLAAGALRVILREILARNKISDGFVYVQVTRGVAPREHAFPLPVVPPSLVVTARAVDTEKREHLAREGVSVLTMPDLRWRRVDIKTTSLLPNVLARQAAKEKGAYEAWLLDSEGRITEGAASNAWIIDRAGTIITRHLDHSILRGITRMTLIDLIGSLGLEFEERSFSREDAFAAREAFITGATAIVMPVVKIDQHKIGDGAPGPITLKLRARFHETAAATT